ncbi:MAG: hypothetical protein AB1938_28430, partial [Myxococcota bacterium]
GGGGATGGGGGATGGGGGATGGGGGATGGGGGATGGGTGGGGVPVGVKLAFISAPQSPAPSACSMPVVVEVQDASDQAAPGRAPRP